MQRSDREPRGPMQLIHLDTVDSTNDYLKRALLDRPDLPEYTVITAREQSAGRGQRGHRWDARPGENLTLTLLLRPATLLEDGGSLFDLNILTALAVRETLIDHLGLPDAIKVKWPNDILVEGRKICGILIENSFLADRLDASIIGIGINVLQEHFGTGYPIPPTSVARELRRSGLPPLSGTDWHDPLVEALVERITQLRALDRTHLREMYHSHLYHYRETARFARMDGTIYPGRIEEVLPDGRLLVTDLRDDTTDAYPFGTVRQLPPDGDSV